MGKIYVDKDEAKLLNEVIDSWTQDELLLPDHAERLRNTYSVKQFDWHRLAQYSFWIALASGIVAVLSLIFDHTIMKLLANLYDTPNILVSLLAGLCAAFFYYFGQSQKKKFPQRTLSNEASITVGVLFTAICLTFLGKAIDNGSGHYSVLVFISVFIYGALAVTFSSRLLWMFALISLGIWFGAETHYQSHGSYHFWGMNYALRFVVFGGLLTASASLQKRIPRLSVFSRLTFILGLFYLFISLWLLSIFGNYGTMAEWDKERQLNLFMWALFSTITALCFMLYGLKKKDAVCREFGIAFLLINLYSRYFEYFWDITDKALFFGLLAFSFWFIGRKAESIWNLRDKNN